jgi:hypothetical protein
LLSPTSYVAFVIMEINDTRVHTLLLNDTFSAIELRIRPSLTNGARGELNYLKAIHHDKLIICYYGMELQ